MKRRWGAASRLAGATTALAISCAAGKHEPTKLLEKVNEPRDAAAPPDAAPLKTRALPSVDELRKALADGGVRMSGEVVVEAGSPWRHTFARPACLQAAGAGETRARAGGNLLWEETAEGWKRAPFCVTAGPIEIETSGKAIAAFSE